MTTETFEVTGTVNSVNLNGKFGTVELDTPIEISEDEKITEGVINFDTEGRFALCKELGGLTEGLRVRGIGELVFGSVQMNSVEKE